MPISIKFTRNSGVKFYCLDILCAFNPLKQEIIPQQLQNKLFQIQSSSSERERLIETQRGNQQIPLFSTTHTAHFNQQLSQRFSNRNLSQTHKSSMQQIRTSSMGTLLYRPPSQKYMEVARHLRGGRHKQKSLREAMQRDQMSNKSLIREAYNSFGGKSQAGVLMSKAVGLEFSQDTIRDQPKITNHQFNATQFQELTDRDLKQKQHPIIEVTAESQGNDTIQRIKTSDNSRGLPGQHAAVGTVIGYTEQELNKIEAQLWSNKSRSLQNRKALTKLTDTKGNLNVKVHKSIFDNQKIGKYNKNRVSQEGFDDSAINKILFDISKNKKFI